MLKYLLFRMGNTPDSASDNLSFRCAADVSTQKKKKTNLELWPKGD